MLWTLIKTCPSVRRVVEGGTFGSRWHRVRLGIDSGATKVNATRTTRHRSSTERIAIGYSITLSFSIRPAHEAAHRYQIQLLVGRRRIALHYGRKALRQINMM